MSSKTKISSKYHVPNNTKHCFGTWLYIISIRVYRIFFWILDFGPNLLLFNTNCFQYKLAWYLHKMWWNKSRKCFSQFLYSSKNKTLNSRCQNRVLALLNYIKRNRDSGGLFSSKVMKKVIFYCLFSLHYIFELFLVIDRKYNCNLFFKKTYTEWKNKF